MARVTLALVLLLAGCAAPGPRVSQQGARARLAERTSQLENHPDWALRGRIAVSNGDDGGSARVNWDTGPSGYRLWIYAPLGQGTWTLHGNDQEAVLEGGEGTYRGTDAASLIAEHLGWNLPVEAMLYWVRGMPDPDRATTGIEFDHDGHPDLIRQAGWTVRFSEWAHYASIDMPRRLEADQPPYKVKLVVQDWAIGAPATDATP